MKALKRINFGGQVATLFADGTIIWAGLVFPNGLGANAALIKALEA